MSSNFTVTDDTRVSSIESSITTIQNKLNSILSQSQSVGFNSYMKETNINFVHSGLVIAKISGTMKLSVSKGSDIESIGYVQGLRFIVPDMLSSSNFAVEVPATDATGYRRHIVCLNATGSLELVSSAYNADYDYSTVTTRNLLRLYLVHVPANTSTNLDSGSVTVTDFRQFYARGDKLPTTYPAGKVFDLTSVDGAFGVGLYVRTLSSWNLVPTSTGFSPLSVPSGGTGLSTIPTGRLLYGNGTSAISTSSSLTYDGTTFNVSGSATTQTFTVSATAGDVFGIIPLGTGLGANLLGMNSAKNDYEPLQLSAETITLNLRTGSGTASAVGFFNTNISSWTSNATGLELYALTNHAVLRLRSPNTESLFLTSSDTANYIYTTADIPLIFGINNTEKMRLSSVGLGIGESPLAKLHVVKTATGMSLSNTIGSGYGLTHTAGGSDSQLSLAMRQTGNAEFGLVGNFYASQIISNSANSNSLEIYTQGTIPLILGTNSTERMRINGSTGVVSIINSSGTSVSLGTGSGHLNLSNGTYGTAFGVNTSGNGWIQQHRFDGTPTAYDLLLQPVGGNVTINNAPALTKLSVNGVVAQWGANQGYMAVGSGSDFTNYEALICAHDTTNGARIISSGVGTGTIRDFVFGTYDGIGAVNELMRLTAVGDLGIGTSSPASFLSDTNGLVISAPNAGLALNATGTGKTYLWYGAASSLKLYEPSIPGDIIDINPGGKVLFGVGGGTAAARIHAVDTGEQLRLGYDASNYLAVQIDSGGGTNFTMSGPNNYWYFYGHSASTASRIAIDNANANAYGAYTYYLTESAARGFVGALKHGSSGDVLFTGETADGFGIRAETVLEFGIGATGIGRWNTTGLAIGGLFTPLGRIDSRATSGAQLVASYDASNYLSLAVSNVGVPTFTATGSANYFNFVWDRSTASTFSLNNSNANAMGCVIAFLTQSTARAYIGATKHGSSADFIFTGETADALAIRSETVIEMGIGATKTIQISSSNISSSIPINNIAISRGLLQDTYSVAIGYAALATTASGGVYNTAVGYECATRLTTGAYNTALGYSALRGWNSYANTGSNNTAVGYQALELKFSGDSNTAVGFRACRGYSGLYSDNTGSLNTGVGYKALVGVSSGVQNTAVGAEALNTIGSGNNCTALGYNAQVTADNQVQLGNSSTTTYAYGAVQDRSDERDKADIRDSILGLDFILKLRPRDYRWDYREDYAKGKKGISVVKDGTKKRSRFHHGLIAQEVKATMEALGVDFGGYQDHSLVGGSDVKSLGYSEFIAPLVRAIQELHAEVKDLRSKLS